MTFSLLYFINTVTFFFSVTVPKVNTQTS